MRPKEGQHGPKANRRQLQIATRVDWRARRLRGFLSRQFFLGLTPRCFARRVLHFKPVRWSSRDAARVLALRQPERLHEDFRRLAVEALIATWPCKKCPPRQARSLSGCCRNRGHSQGKTGTIICNISWSSATVSSSLSGTRSTPRWSGSQPRCSMTVWSRVRGSR